MSPWWRWRPARGRTAARASGPASGRGPDSAHLEAFARTREGVEGYLEPRTAATPMTLLLVAADGEWTRRPVPDARTAQAFARGLGVPFLDVAFTGYPQRMRDWTTRRRREERDPRHPRDLT